MVSNNKKKINYQKMYYVLVILHCKILTNSIKERRINSTAFLQKNSELYFSPSFSNNLVPILNCAGKILTY